MTNRTVFFVSDGTGITSETFGTAILAQFDVKLRYVRLPFVDSIDKAIRAVRDINEAALTDGNRPIVFTTLVNAEVLGVITDGCQGLLLDMFGTFIFPLEAELQLKSSHHVGRFSDVSKSKEYQERIEAINFSTEDYWGDKARYKFRTSISDYNFQTETVADSDRIVKTTFTMIVYAYLLPETFENHKQTVEKAFTPRKIVFDSEVTGDISTVGGKKKSKLIHVGLPSGSMQSPSTGTGGSQNAHVLWADRAGYAEIADFVYSSVIIVSSSYADSASLATTASYLTYQPNVPTVVSSLTILNGGAQSSLNTNQTTGVNSAISVDAIPVGSGNVASWMVSIFDGTNYQASEVLANWNNVGSAIDYAEISVNQIGRVPVFLSVIYNSGFIYLIATPVSGTWTVKVLRMTI